MARFLRNAALKRVICAAESGCSRRGTLALTSHFRDFSAKAKRKTKTNGIDSGEENMSKKEIALHQAVEQITDTFGKGAIMWLGRSESYKEVPVISSGSLAIDTALGIGGFPKGRVVEIYGPEASGKTTLALHVVAEAQKQGGYCVFVDAEHALDPALARAVGVKTENLLLSQPDCGEQALSLVDTIIRSGSVDVVVVDSVAALVPKAELDGEMGDSHIALQARLMSQALRKLSHALSLSHTLLIFINQVRQKVSTFGYGGPVEVTSGGNALKFYASVRLNIKRIGAVKKGEEVIGSHVQVKIVKNKLAPPFKVAEFDIIFGEGISRGNEILDYAIKFGLVAKNGSFYKYKDLSFHGNASIKQYLLDNEAERLELLARVREKIAPSEINEDQNDDEAEEALTGEEAGEVTSETTTDEETIAAVEA
ncbi:hypothetical protein QJS04_geneDACA021514 [Acorus gramineus]|uniref:Uncharacterized protein n=1 Tax=Acorus gramineus TaxID=55184 RepID=A0AAV9A6Y8_ACOGR|nr:hypothetical protein QJS04_geneDACA021514 [Acorus gramineus]